MRKLVLLLVVLFFMAGCAAPKPNLYYWGNYSQTLYACKKNPCPETELQHKETLLNIVSESEQLGLKVPPGIYCELGYNLVNAGEKEEGKKYLLLEKQTYPESTALVDRLMAQLQ